MTQIRLRKVHGVLTGLAMLGMASISHADGKVYPGLFLHEGEEGRAAFLESGMLGNPPFDTAAFFMPTPDGIGTIVYSSRTGHTLAKVEF